MATKAEQKRQQRDQAIERLRETFPRGATVNVIIKHVTGSGMQRSMTVLSVDEDGVIHNDSWLVARALEWRFDDRRDAVKVNGCGMDMVFHLAYVLAQVLYGDGYALNSRKI